MANSLVGLMGDLARLRGGSFLVLGRAGMDFYADPPGTRLQEATFFQAELGGSAANIAAGLCRLGLAATLVTRVSDDAVGRFCLNQLDRYGIDRRFVRFASDGSRNSLAVVDSRLEDNQCVIYRHRAADLEMDQEDVNSLPYLEHSALVASGAALAAEPSRSAILLAFDKAAQAGLPLILDIDHRPHSWASAQEASTVYSQAAELCDIVIGNDVEFGVMSGEYDGGLEIARSLVRNGTRIAIYKMGGDGMIAISAQDETRIGVYPASPLKPTGAGDGFMAGFLSGLATDRPLREAACRGAAVAALVVSRVGCAPAMPEAEELDAFMAKHDPPIEE